MFITRNPGQALELCYVAQKMRAANLDEPKTDYTPSRGERWAITWDANKCRIVSIPPQRHDATETKRGRAPTTGRIANWIVQGRILAAAERQAQPKADFLRFLYDPECPAVVRGRVSKWAQQRLAMIPTTSQKNKIARIWETDISDALLLQFAQMIRGGGERYTETQLSNYAGYASMSEANWARDWRRLAGMFMLQLQDFECVAMRPVVKTLDAIFHDRGTEVARQHHDKPEPASDATRANRPAPKHGTTLSLRRGIAS